MNHPKHIVPSASLVKVFCLYYVVARIVIGLLITLTFFATIFYYHQNNVFVGNTISIIGLTSALILLLVSWTILWRRTHYIQFLSWTSVVRGLTVIEFLILCFLAYP